jgi:hypothetical protein
MPEGPEIRRAADRIARAVEGRVAEEVFFGLPRLTEYADELTGRRVEGIETRGKAMLTHFDCGLSVYSHNQLYGRWYVVRAGAEPATNRDLRLALETATHRALLYSASEIDPCSNQGSRGRRIRSSRSSVRTSAPAAQGPRRTGDPSTGRQDDRGVWARLPSEGGHPPDSEGRAPPAGGRAPTGPQALGLRPGRAPVPEVPKPDRAPGPRRPPHLPLSHLPGGVVLLACA